MSTRIGTWEWEYSQKHHSRVETSAGEVYITPQGQFRTRLPDGRVIERDSLKACEAELQKIARKGYADGMLVWYRNEPEKVRVTTDGQGRWRKDDGHLIDGSYTVYAFNEDAFNRLEEIYRQEQALSKERGDIERSLRRLNKEDLPEVNPEPAPVAAAVPIVDVFGDKVRR